ncbi:hypothetical protein [Streptomyces spectabilis]|uniref:Uncharacterized protein n=1 Tax=Streptomyces spectabilis TaxID=68270 RepID=A0A7W8ARL4_STRST|nr:hypothetical protein [Streptomyces spectabilis]MBB5103263.1 hypothetical protein [Streptomyces spectabilis]MCI3902454.1 hypothetical protein [Streptomyces spectabilis]GGV13774.1 hypothetical protein GCM10010245_24010 [Streptomyces spectabilis]
MNACGLCERPSEHSYLCPGCARGLAESLDQLPVLHDELVECLVPRRYGFGDIVATRGAAGPRSPLDEDVLDEMNSGHMAAVVHLWRVDVQRVRWPSHGEPPPAGLAADCRWLAMELNWIAAEYVAAGDLAREVSDLERDARSIVGDPAPRPQRLGTCVAVDTGGVVCGAVIKRMPGQTRLRCRWCGYTYETAQDWMRLQHFQPEEVA